MQAGLQAYSSGASAALIMEDYSRSVIWLPMLIVVWTGMQAVLQAYSSGASAALIMEDDMDILRWPLASLIFTAPPAWEALLLYMMGPDADAIYR